jgi:hypothetical protein
MGDDSDSVRSSKRIHTVLGAGGAIAGELTREPLAAKQSIRLVSRQPPAVASVLETKAAALSEYRQALDAVTGTSVAYLCVGLKYDFKIWRELWLKIMQNTIDACKARVRGSYSSTTFTCMAGSMLP